MPHIARFQKPDSLYHVMAHSIDTKKLFIDNEDKAEFLSRFEKGLADCKFQCFAWALMDNHYHLFIKTNKLRLHKLMRGLNGGYALYYNKKHHRTGYLFQGRFKSILCQDKQYAKTLVRYIHMNPVRAGIVKSLQGLENWSWCGHAALLGKKGFWGETFQNRLECLSRFSENSEDAVNAYLQFITESFSDEERSSVSALSDTDIFEMTKSCKGKPAVIGDPDFANEIFETTESFPPNKHRKADYNYVLDNLSQKICAEFELTKKEIMRRGRINNRSFAREKFCYLAHVEEMIPLSVISIYLKISIPPVAILVSKGAPKKELLLEASIR